jgi:hypothetical protein
MFNRTAFQRKLLTIATDDAGGDEKVVLRKFMHAILEKITDCRRSTKVMKELLKSELQINRHLSRALRMKGGQVNSLKAEILAQNVVWEKRCVELKQQLLNLKSGGTRDLNDDNIIVDVEMSESQVEESQASIDGDDEWLPSQNAITSTLDVRNTYNTRSSSKKTT